MSAIQADRCKVPQAFWRVVERMGLAPPALLRQARLPATLHVSGDTLITTEQYFALWSAFAELKADPDLGIKLVEATETSAHPPASMAAFYARDYRDGLSRMVRFKHICTAENLHIVERRGECSITVKWPYATRPEPDILTDLVFAALVELGRRGTGLRVVPSRVEFARRGPRTDLRKAYFGCPIRYGSPRNLLVLRTSDLDRPFPGHNPELLEVLAPALSSTLCEIQARSSVSEQVKVVLKRGLASGRPELLDIARELRMSRRTLQRRILEEGKTFRDLLSEARQEVVRELLSDPSTTIDEVAYLLGYQDSASFYRAFRDWEGVTPNHWRTRNGNELRSSEESKRMIH